MTRQIRLFLYFLVGFMLSANCILAFAESTVPAPGFTWYINNYSSGVGYDSPQPGCNDQGLQLFAAGGWSSSAWTLETPVQMVELSSSYFQCNIRVKYQTSYQNLGQRYMWKVSSLVCAPNQNWTLINGMCTRPDCVLPEVRDLTTGLCKIPVPTCIGAQFLNESTNKCECTYQPSTTKSYQVSYANAKAGNLNPPTCSNGCTQAYTGHFQFCPGALATMVVGGSTTCYAASFQDGTICSSAGGGTGEPIQITMQAPTAPAAPGGVNQNGVADPVTTPSNNSDPLTCANSGGGWGVFNGLGTCYTPTKTDPVTTKDEQKITVKDPLGKETTTTTTTTNTCTGAGACTSTTSTVYGGGGGTAGGSTVTSTGKGASGSANVTADGAGNYKLDLPTDYQRDATGQLLNNKIDALLEVIGKPTADDSSITGAKATDEGKKALTDAEKAITDNLNGQENQTVLEKVSIWRQTMESGWFTPIPSSACSAFDQKIGPYNWHFDHCPKAAEISQWGAYCAWILLMFTGFRMLTTPVNTANR